MFPTRLLRNTAMTKQLQMKLRVRYMLSQHQSRTIEPHDFHTLCTKEVGMTPEDSSKFLDALHRARIVIRHDDKIFVRPHQIVDRVHSHLNIPHLLTKGCESKTESREVLSKSEPAFEKVSMWRNRFWNGVALGSGSQMTVLAYLTFVTYGWDVMEPACYFVTCATSIAFYLYFLFYQREQSLQQVDENFLPLKLKSSCQDIGVDISRLSECMNEIQSDQETNTVDKWFLQQRSK